MISSQGELSTQALEDVEKVRAKMWHYTAAGVTSNSDTTGSSSVGVVVVLVTASSALEDKQLGMDVVDLTKDGTIVTAPIAPSRSFGRSEFHSLI